MTGSSPATATTTGTTTRTSSPQKPAAVSATKQRAHGGRRTKDASGSNNRSSRNNRGMPSSPPRGGELCLALYRSKKLHGKTKKDAGRNRRSQSESQRGIWWPALRFPSIGVFLDETQGQWSPGDSDQKARHKLVRRALREAVRGESIETVLYLGRPPSDYCAADEAARRGVEVRDLSEGLLALTRQARSPLFPKRFARGGPGGGGEPCRELFRSFYEGMDRAMARIDADACGDSSDSDSDSDSDSESGEKRSWASQGRAIWEDYHKGGSRLRAGDPPREEQERDDPQDLEDPQDHREHHLQEHEAQGKQERMQAQAQEHEQEHAHDQEQAHDREHMHEQEQEDEDEGDASDPHNPNNIDNNNINHHHQRQHHDDQSVSAHSAAAVSYTEASLMSRTETHAQAQEVSMPSPPSGLEYESVLESDKHDFDRIWHKHQMEGWDRFLEEDAGDGGDSMVYTAPNGYRFGSHGAFVRYLEDTYGYCGEGSGCRSRSPSRRGRSPSRAETKRGGTKRAGSRGRSASRSRSRSLDSRDAGWTDLWLYLRNTLGWTYEYPTREDAKKHGMGTTAIWFRPGFGAKHRGRLGRDHFAREEAVADYCRKHGIVVPGQGAGPDEPHEQHNRHGNRHDHKNYQHQHEHQHEQQHEQQHEYDDDDDDGYTTPDDQSTVPQDPGKPRLASPQDPPCPGDSGRSGGSSHSEDDPDRYVFPVLWDRLTSKGWSWCKARNHLDDYWYVRTASIRPVSEWIRGTDYFVTEEEVVAFCKKRDDLSRKEREARRRNQLLGEQSTSKSKSNKKKNKSSSSINIKINKNKKDQAPAASGAKSAAAGRKRKTAGRKPKKPSKKPKQRTDNHLPTLASCEDANLRVDYTSKRYARTPPWVANPPVYKHALCLNATGMHYCGGYYLPAGDQGKNRKNSVRFASVEECASYFARNPGELAWKARADGDGEPSTPEEKAFDRLVRYALVPGLQSTWSTIRPISRSETAFLLTRLGYQRQQQQQQQPQQVLAASRGGDRWEPPAALVCEGILEASYGSLEALCEALRSVEGDLRNPPGHNHRRRRARTGEDGATTDLQFKALRLRIAEGFSEADDELEDESEAEFDDEPEDLADDKAPGGGAGPSSPTGGGTDKGNDGNLPRPASARPQAGNGPSGGASSHPEAGDLASKKRKWAPASDETKSEAETDEESSRDESESESDSESDDESIDEESNHESIDEESEAESAAKSTDQSTDQSNGHVSMTEGFGDDSDEALALSPSKIKVGSYRKNPHDNTAPWATNPPRAKSWTKLYQKMGFAFKNSVYHLPDESHSKHTERFPSIEELRIYLCTKGNWHQYLQRLDTDGERNLVARHIRYAHVPGNHHDWRRLRQLEIDEIILFLTLLGFEKSGKFDWWGIPDGVPQVGGTAYPTLSALGNALVRVPDLEDRTMGMSYRRRSRITEDEKVLNDYQMMALRLAIAEGLPDEDIPRGGGEEKDEARTSNETSVGVSDEPLIDFSSDAVERLIEETINPPKIWRLLQTLGCSWSGTNFYIRGLKRVFYVQNEMIDFLLKHGVGVLDWDGCTLDEAGVASVVRYLKAFYIRGCSLSVVEEALAMVTKTTVRRCLESLGIHEEDGAYRIDSEELTESDVVNAIRSNPDLRFVKRRSSSPIKRRRSGSVDPLTRLETLAVRYWAALSDAPLPGMPSPSAIGAHRGGGATEAPRGSIEEQASDTKDTQSTETTQEIRWGTPERPSVAQPPPEPSANAAEVPEETPTPLGVPGKPNDPTQSPNAKESQDPVNDISAKPPTEPMDSAAASENESLEPPPIEASQKNASNRTVESGSAPMEEDLEDCNPTTSLIEASQKDGSDRAVVSGSTQMDKEDLQDHNPANSPIEASERDGSKNAIGSGSVPMEEDLADSMPTNSTNDHEPVSGSPEATLAATEGDYSKSSFATQETENVPLEKERTASVAKPFVEDFPVAPNPSLFQCAAKIAELHARQRKNKQAKTGVKANRPRANPLGEPAANVGFASPKPARADRCHDTGFFSPMHEPRMQASEEFATPKQYNGSLSSPDKENGRPEFARDDDNDNDNDRHSYSGEDQHGWLTQPAFEGNDGVDTETGEDDCSIDTMERPARFDLNSTDLLTQGDESNDGENWFDRTIFS